MREVIITSMTVHNFITIFLVSSSINNLGLALGMALKFYMSVAKGLTLKAKS